MYKQLPKQPYMHWFTQWYSNHVVLLTYNQWANTPLTPVCVSTFKQLPVQPHAAVYARWQRAMYTYQWCRAMYFGRYPFINTNPL